DVRLEALADVAEERMVAHRVHAAGELVVHLDEVDVDVLEDEQAPVPNADESRELGRVGLGEDLRDLALAVRFDLGDDDGPLDHGGSWRILDANRRNRTLARHSCPPETRTHGSWAGGQTSARHGRLARNRPGDRAWPCTPGRL